MFLKRGVLELLGLGVLGGDELVGHSDVGTEVDLEVLLPWEYFERPRRMTFRFQPVSSVKNLLSGKPCFR